MRPALSPGRRSHRRIFWDHEPAGRSRGHETHFFSRINQSLLTSPPTIQGFNARNFVLGKSLPVERDEGKGVGFRTGLAQRVRIFASHFKHLEIPRIGAALTSAAGENFMTGFIEPALLRGKQRRDVERFANFTCPLEATQLQIQLEEIQTIKR